MSRPTVFLCKFVGTTSLGLLTGLNYTLSTKTIPALLSLPTIAPAHSTFGHLREVTSRHQILLSTISASSFILAYALSPSRGRHPYLIWTTLVVGCGFWQEVAYLWRGKGDEETRPWGVEEFGHGKEKGSEEDVETLNGEALRDRMEAWKASQLIRTGVWGLGWAMSVVGIWGDVY